MSEFRKLIEESVESVELDEGIGSVIRNGLLGATMALGAMQGANAKTDPEMLRSGAHQVTAQYEHGGKGYKAIVKDNYGGYSYGKEQLSTRRLNSNDANSTFDAFMKYANKKATAEVGTVIEDSIPSFAEPWPEHNIEFDTAVMISKGYVSSIRKTMNGINGYEFVRANGNRQFIRVEMVIIQKMARKI